MPNPTRIRGRFFTVLLKKALEHYERHKETIDAALTEATIALIVALIEALPEIVAALNPRGPQ